MRHHVVEMLARIGQVTRSHTFFRTIHVLECRGRSKIDILKLIDQLESLVEECHQFINFTVGFDREEFLELTSKIRASLPDEVRKACRVTAESERIVGGAREAAEATVNDAQVEAQRLIQNAQAQAEKMLREAEQRAQGRVQESDGYAQKVISEAHARVEDALTEGHQQAERLIAEARQQASQMINDSEVMRLATAQAKEIIASADRDGRELRRGSEEYAREELMRLDKLLRESLTVVERGKVKLDQRLTAHDNPPVSGGGSRAVAPMNGDLVGGRR